MRGAALLAILVLLPAPAQAVGLANAEISPHGEVARADVMAPGGRQHHFGVEPPVEASAPARLPHASLPGQDARLIAPAAKTASSLHVDDVQTANLSTLALRGALTSPLARVSASTDGSSLVHVATKRLEAPGASPLAPPTKEAPALGAAPAAPMPQAGDASGAKPNAGYGTSIRNHSNAQTQSTAIPRAMQAGGATQHVWRAVAYAAGALILLLAPIALYHRLRGAQALESGQRARLVEVIRASPGLSMMDVARSLQIHPTTARYHLRRLVKEDILVVEDGVKYFVAGSVPRAQRAGVVALDGREEVLAAVRASPGLTVTDLARVLGVGRSTMRWHVAKLAQAGLVALARDGRAVRVRPEGFE